MSETLLPFEKIKREILVRRELKTGANYGKRPEDRTMTELLDMGVINVDKPKGPTSHQVSAYVQQILNITKSGHGGTLDPGVTGCLPVALGKGTRIVQALLPAGKEYVMIMHLHREIEESIVRDTINSFIGKIKQLPPIKSAIKREWRIRKIYYIQVIEVDGQDVLMRVGCQAGTYMRKLATDIGLKLGIGAHMAELRRTKAGPFNEKTITSLQDLTDAFWVYKNEQKEDKLRKIILPIEFAVSHLGKIWVCDSCVDTLCHGANLNAPGIAKVESEIQQGELVAMMTLKNELICLGISQIASHAMVKAQRGLVVNVTKVFMDPAIYPKMVKKDYSERFKEA
ncbi:MAG: RNA-guided pseudouridylation complex pseudouridine synthase subunit Cbf5 [Candidatus Woesearchaeota archaeon]